MSAPKKASTVIIVTRTNQKLKQNYKIFMLKRSSESRFMPSAYVFPGGAIDDVDSSSEWNNLYKKLSKDQFPNTSKITGIREVFEESGILLFNNLKNQIQDLKTWRDDVHKDSKKFLEFCEKYECVPDMNSLMLYSKWTGPKQEKRRYETDFYLTKIDVTNSEMIHDGKETTDSQWISPSEALESFENGKLFLAPPTWYTLQEMNQYNDIDDLLEFCKNRKVEQWEPTLSKVNDSIVVALPGDPLHETIHSNIYHRIILESKSKYRFVKSKL